MRYVYAIIALVLAGVLLVLGVGQQTFLAGPDAIVKQAPSGGSSSYAVISAETLDSVVGRPVIELRGEEPFAAIGSLADIEAWLAPFDHVVFAATAEGDTLAATSVAGKLPEPTDDEAAAAEEAAPAEGAEATEPPAIEQLDPRGSDLWISERSDKTKVSLPVALQPNQAVLIATNGTDALPSEISVSWMQSQRAPLAGPFIVAGLVFGIAGAVLYLLAVDHDRRGLGPRRGKRGPLRGVRDLIKPGQRSAQADEPATASEAPTSTKRLAHRPTRLVAALGLVGALGLTGCSANYWPDFSPAPSASEAPAETDPGAEIAPVPVSAEQIDHIITSVSEVAAAGDDELDAELLKERFTGDALEQRTANYKIRSSVADYQAPPRITNTRLEYELVQSTEGWPRTIFVVVESSAEALAANEPSAGEETDSPVTASPSLALVLTQAGPHENFLVTNVAEVHGGITMPPAAPASEGTALLDEDIKTLRLTPDLVGDAYADILQNGEASTYASDFDLSDDVLLEKMGLAWSQAAQSEADAAGQKVQHSVSVSEGSRAPVTLSTGEGGALVSVTINDDLISSSSDPQSKVKPTPSVTALSGITDSQDRIVQHWTHQMLFFVPSADSGQLIRVLGSTSAMIGAGS